MNTRPRIVELLLGIRLRRRPTIALLVGCVLSLNLSTALSADPSESTREKKPSSISSLDDELFKDLGDDATTGKKADAVKADSPGGSKPGESKPLEAKPSEPKPNPVEPSDTRPTERRTSPNKPLDPLDEELLKDLGGDADPKLAKKPKEAARGSSSETRPATGEPAKGDVDQPEPDRTQSDDPLVRLSRRVRAAEERLRRTDSGEQTQELQRGIVEDLENLIAQIEKQKAQQSSSKSKSPPGGAKPGPKKPGPPKPGSQPGDKPSSNPTDSSDQLTAKKTEKPETGKLKEMLEKVWGRLPERERQDVMQSSFEDFPAKYQYSIEQYFKVLLERKD